MNIDIQSGVATFTPPVLVAGELTSRIMGLSVNEWFYIVSMFCMVISAGASLYVAVKKASTPKSE